MSAPQNSATPKAEGGEARLLEQATGAHWPAIAAAQAKTEQLRAQLREVLVDIEDANCSVIVTGSLGRGEATGSSDADWLLLVDGPSNPDHARMTRKIADAVPDSFKDVGRTGTFGDIVASHELVHHIAGTRDTNENLTRRMLLLAESHALNGSYCSRTRDPERFGALCRT